MVCMSTAIYFALTSIIVISEFLLCCVINLIAFFLCHELTTTLKLPQNMTTTASITVKAALALAPSDLCTFFYRCVGFFLLFTFLHNRLNACWLVV